MSVGSRDRVLLRWRLWWSRLLLSMRRMQVGIDFTRLIHLIPERLMNPGGGEEHRGEKPRGEKCSKRLWSLNPCDAASLFLWSNPPPGLWLARSREPGEVWQACLAHISWIIRTNLLLHRALLLETASLSTLMENRGCGGVAAADPGPRVLGGLAAWIWVSYCLERRSEAPGWWAISHAAYQQLWKPSRLGLLQQRLETETHTVKHRARQKTNNCTKAQTHPGDNTEASVWFAELNTNKHLFLTACLWFMTPGLMNLMWRFGEFGIFSY